MLDSFEYFVYKYVLLGIPIGFFTAIGITMCKNIIYKKEKITLNFLIHHINLYFFL